MSKLRVLSLFAGIGGFDLGLERTGGFETVAFCEFDKKAQAVLRKHWPEVPIYDDVRTLTGERLAADGIAVDVICGGFPCQPFSTAARGRNVAANLWPEMLRVIAEVRPRIVIGENVQERPMLTARRDLQAIGYIGKQRRIAASDIGADHQRDRWWLCAYTDDESQLSRAFDAEMAFVPQICSGLWGADNYARAIRVSDGISGRVDRLRQLGNAVVPQVVELIGRAILASLTKREAA